MATSLISLSSMRTSTAIICTLFPSVWTSRASALTATSLNGEALPSSGTLNRDTDCIMATSEKRKDCPTASRQSILPRVFHDYQFQTIGELRALLSLYNLTVEEVRGNVRGQDYNGLVYSVIDADGNKVGNPFKSSLFGKSVGYEALQKKAAFSKKNIKDRNLTEPTRKALEYALKRTYDKDEFVRMLKEKGIDCVFRYTDEGRIYGATFIDHRTHCVLNGSRMGKAFSANALERHFNTPPEEQIPFKEKEEQEEHPNTGSTSAEGHMQSTSHDEQEHYESRGGFASFLDALDILNTDNPVTDAEEEAFRRKLQRKKKKRRGPKL